MPYIKLEARPKFAELINNVVLTVMRNNTPHFVRAEYFGFFVDRLVNRYMVALDTVNPFNAVNFEATIRKTFEDYASKLMALVNRDDPINSAGELNYIVSCIWWGIVGDHAEVEQAGYGFRSVTRGMLEHILDNVNNTRFVTTTPTGQVHNLRRAIVVKSVLNDVIDEIYRQKTVPYEDLKISENGTLWQDGALLASTEQKLLGVE